MYKVNAVVMLGFVVFAAGCMGPRPVLSPEAKAIPIMKSDPPAKCQEIETLYGHGYSDDERKDRMRDQAFKKGINYIRLDTVTTDGNLKYFTGTGFKCK